MSNEMVTQLLRADEHKAEMLHALGRAHDDLVSAHGEYRQAWRAATSVGWAKTILVRAGFLSPDRLPDFNDTGSCQSRSTGGLTPPEQPNSVTLERPIGLPPVHEVAGDRDMRRDDGGEQRSHRVTWRERITTIGDVLTALARLMRGAEAFLDALRDITTP